MPTFTLAPAYGRDYKSAAAAEKDLRDNKDFIEVVSRQYINLPQLVELGHREVFIRYQRLTKITQVKL